MAKDKSEKLNGRQARFVAEKIKNPTISNTEAARKAGYSKTSARFQGSKIATNSNISEKIETAKEQVIERAIGTAEEADNILWRNIVEADAEDSGKGRKDVYKGLELWYKRRGLLSDKQQVEMTAKVSVLSQEQIDAIARAEKL